MTPTQPRHEECFEETLDRLEQRLQDIDRKLDHMIWLLQELRPSHFSTQHP